MEKEELLSKIAEILQINEPLKEDIKQLYMKLKAYRAELHPDKIVDPNQKGEYEEEFKKITPLLECLEKEMAKEQKSQLPAKISKKSFDKSTDLLLEIKLRQSEDHIVNLKGEIVELNTKNEQLRNNLEESKKQNTQKSEQIVKEKAKPKNLPSKISMGFVGVLALMTSFSNNLFGLLNQFQTNKVISESLLPIIFWIIFAFFGYRVIQKQYRKDRLNMLLEMLCTADFRKNFRSNIKKHNLIFNEIDIVDFIKSECNNIDSSKIQIVKKMLNNSITSIDYNYLAQAFLARMEEEKLITYVGVADFMKTYKLIETRSYLW